MRNFPRPDNHDSGKFAVPVQVAVERYIHNHPPSVLRGMHEMKDTCTISIRQSNMFSKTFRTVSADTNDVAILNS